MICLERDSNYGIVAMLKYRYLHQKVVFYNNYLTWIAGLDKAAQNMSALSLNNII